MHAEVGPSSQVARVRTISDDGLRTYLDFRNGQTASVDTGEPAEWSVGDVVLVRGDENQVEVVPDGVWPEEPWIGVVRLRLDDITAVEVAGRLVRISTNDVTYGVGNTVEGVDGLGVVRVLDEKPLKMLDLPGVDESVVARFRRAPGGDGPSFDDFGGYEWVKDRARELIELPLREHEALGKIGARPIKGVLFTGLPGTGKTMLARIIAGRSDATFYEIKGPEVFSKWYGESEELIRKIFEDAGRQTRSIIFFDEIDSVAAQRAGEAHEVTRRVVAQLLTLMDGFSADDNVVVVATTNRPQDIDVALRRPGRFDWEIDFPLPSLQDREAILRVRAKELTTYGELQHARMAARTASWSAAELAAIYTEAALLAVDDHRAVIMEEDYFGGYSRVATQRARVAAQATETAAA